ncbi:MAG: hypothetical protein IJZ57_00565 [Clostridia bacterium]|nr:hypothetical protein [Clostridia bacterium]
MKTRIVALIMSVVMIALLFNGCSLSLKAPETLMSPPKLTGGHQALQDIFETEVGTNAALIAPINGEHKSAFIIDDFNSDSMEEAMVFYSVKETEETVSVGIFQKENEEWKYIKSVTGLGSSIDTVVIEDMNGDGIKEIIIGWNLSTFNKQVSVYEPDLSLPNAFTGLGSYQYNLLEMIDVDSDGGKELFFVNLDTTGVVPSATANVFKIEENKRAINELSTISIDGNVSGYNQITVGDDGYIYVDAFKNEHDMITEILSWDDKTNSLNAPLFDSETQSTTATWRSFRIPVSDIDSDGKLEVPVGVEVVGSTQVKSGALQEESIYYVKWCSFADGKLKAEKYCLYNTAEGYSLDIPSSWVGKITITSLDSQWYFYRWNKSASEHLGDLLFTVVSHATDTPGLDGYSRLTEYNNKAYEYLITASGKSFGVKDNHFKDGFSVTDIGG